MSPTLNQLLVPIAYQLVWDEYSSADVQLVLRRGRDGFDRWAIQEHGQCYGKSGRWAYEPLPSSRTDDWLEVYRFATKEDALRTWFTTHGRSRYVPSGHVPGFEMMRPEGL